MLAAAGISATAIVISLVTVSGAVPGGSVVHVIEHADNDVVIDTGASGDTSGDLLTFANTVFDDRNRNAAGHDLGSCVRIDPAKGSWQCTFTTWVDGGQITVSGPFYDTRDSVLAIIGGTGDYSGATGNMQLKARNGGLEYDFIFRLAS
jgi:hypothetical protein